MLLAFPSLRNYTGIRSSVSGTGGRGEIHISYYVTASTISGEMGTIVKIPMC